MKHIQNEPFGFQSTCVAFGYFDGVHLGHRAIADKVVSIAKEKGYTPVLVSFNQDNGQSMIMTTEKEKAYLLQNTGLEAMVSIAPATVDEAFIKTMLVEKLNAKIVVIEPQHPAGELLHQASSQLGFSVIECSLAAEYDQALITQKLSDLIASCKMEEAAQLMGHPYIILGPVGKGKQLGRTVGLPTANIEFAQNKLLPPSGSYAATTIRVNDGIRRVGLVNIGRRPTVDDFEYVTVENHLFDFAENLYGEELVLEVHRFIRGVDVFNSLEDMKTQVDKDILSIRQYLDTLC